MKNYMYMNVILSFRTANEFGDTQEFFECNLPINKAEKDAFTFLNKKFFKAVLKKCELFNRKPEDLWKISTASNWGLFEQVTNKPSLKNMGHCCKWFFNDEINELDFWEKDIKQLYGFGINY